ncbi:MAG: hypothetical protein Q4E71_06295, partial [Prevotella sp.]|nr:hypothetical protein [Prevotella sp.]
MNRKIMMLLGAAAAVMTAGAQEVVKVGKGSYASYTPLELCRSEYHVPGDYGWKGDQSKYMQYRQLWLHERDGQPIPTNDWWTNLITQPYSGRMWTYPQIVQARPYGVDVQAPSFWLDNGTEMKSNTVLSVAGTDFAPAAAIAESWHDWDVEFSMSDGERLMYVTMAHGMPFTWIEMRGVTPQLSLARSSWTVADFTATEVEIVGADGRPLFGGASSERVVTDRLAMKMGGDVYGIYLPEGTAVTLDGGRLNVSFSGSQQYVSVGMLHSVDELTAMGEYAYSVPRDTRVTWRYDAAAGKMRTRWTVTAEDLRTGVPVPDISDPATPPVPPMEPGRPEDDGSLTVGTGEGGYDGPAHAPRRGQGGGVKVLQG